MSLFKKVKNKEKKKAHKYVINCTLIIYANQP